MALRHLPTEAVDDQPEGVPLLLRLPQRAVVRLTHRFPAPSPRDVLRAVDRRETTGPFQLLLSESSNRMTQQPYAPGPVPGGYPQQYPSQQYPSQQPQQGYPAQPGYPGQQPAPQQFQQPMAPQQPYAPGPAQGGYPGQAPAQPQVQLAQGSIDDFYNQPSVGGGPSLSWSFKDGSQKPVNSAYTGVIARDITNADIQQETDIRTGQPKTYRDGRPKFVMKVPLRGVTSNLDQPGVAPEYPDGEAVWYVKGQSREELNRAMAEAGVQGAPKGGATITITLVGRKPMGAGMNPANQVQVRYQPGAGAASPAPAPEQAAQPAPAAPQQFQPQPPATQPAAPQQEQAPQWAQPAAPQAQPQMQAAPVGLPAGVPQAVPAQGAPAPAPAPQPPAGMTPEAQAILAGLTGQQG